MYERLTLHVKWKLSSSFIVVAVCMYIVWLAVTGLHFHFDSTNIRNLNAKEPPITVPTSQGWRYSSFGFHHEFSHKKTFSSCVRRRCWIRDRKFAATGSWANVMCSMFAYDLFFISAFYNSYVDCLNDTYRHRIEIETLEYLNIFVGQWSAYRCITRAHLRCHCWWLWSTKYCQGRL